MKVLQWACLAAVVLSSSAGFGQDDSPMSGRLAISIGGVQATVLGFTGGDDPGDKAKPSSSALTVTVDRTGSDAMWQWIATSINQGPVEKTIEVQAKGKRRAVFSGAHITEIKLDDLDANGKAPMTATVKIVPKTVAPAADASIKGTVSTKQKKWLSSNFRLRLGDLPLSTVSKVDSFTLKVKVVEGKPVLEPGDLRVTLATSDAKAVADALAKDKSAPLTIALTGDDGGVWKTLTLTGLKIAKTKASGASSNIVMKGTKILIN